MSTRPAISTGGAQRGFLIPIGGAEEKEINPTILKRFIALCGGVHANIVVIPTASRLADTGSLYVELFENLGAARVDFMQLKNRKDCERPSFLERLDQATGIFITGGNQLRLSTIVGGTPMADKFRHLNAHGVHIAGTSAGAAVIPEHMIAGGDPGPTPTQAGVTLTPGLGLINTVVIDQHFRQRDRLGRLLTALAYNPYACGLGIDEDTAAFIGPDGVLEVVGKGAITVVDPSNLDYSSISEIRKGEVVTLLNIRLHILAAGAQFDTISRKPFVHAELEPEELA